MFSKVNAAGTGPTRALVGKQGSRLRSTERGFEVQSGRCRGVSPLGSSLGQETAPRLLRTWNLGGEFTLTAVHPQPPLLAAKERQGGICIPELLHV